MKLPWFKSYKTSPETLREHFLLVAEKTGSSEAEAIEHISSIESKLVTMQSSEGIFRLDAAASSMRSDLDNLGPKYRRQNHCRCCGVATLAIAWDLLLKKSNIEGCLTEEDDMFKISTILKEDAVKQRGMVLEELFSTCEEIFGNKNYQITKELPKSVEDLKEVLKTHFRLLNETNERGIILCNYDMKVAGQGDWWGGHISPIAAYDMISDSVLILDVWKYTDPVWIPMDKLYKSTMQSVDLDSKKSRGFVRIAPTKN